MFSLEPSELTEQGRRQGSDVHLVSEAVMSSLAETQHPRGPVAVMDRPDPEPADTETVLVLWGIQDPGNVGTLIRTAAIFGLGVIVAGASADPWGSKALRASAGGCFATQLEHGPDLAVSDLRQRGYVTVGLVTKGGMSPEELPFDARLSLLIGSEAHGLPADVQEQVDLQTTIPMPGWRGTLNAAAAGAVVAYLASRNAGGQRGGSD